LKRLAGAPTVDRAVSNHPSTSPDEQRVRDRDALTELLTRRRAAPVLTEAEFNERLTAMFERKRQHLVRT
jgi:hypothetical protein